MQSHDVNFILKTVWKSLTEVTRVKTVSDTNSDLIQLVTQPFMRSYPFVSTAEGYTIWYDTNARLKYLGTILISNQEIPCLYK